MFISHKNNTIISFHETEWQCRLRAKGMTKAEYWAWIDSITTYNSDGDATITYPSEDFTIVECTDEDVDARLGQLSVYQTIGNIFNIKYYVSKRDALDSDGDKIVDVEAHTIAAHTLTDEDGNETDVAEEVVAETYVQSHFVGDDTAKDARLLAEEWTKVRSERTRLLTETDYLALSDQTLSADMTTYRQDLRDVPTQSDPIDIDWPVKPS